MTNPYNPTTGQWLTPFAWAPITAPAAGGAQTLSDLAGSLSPDVMAALGIGPDRDPGARDIPGGQTQDNGFSGTVNTFGDFAKAIGGGVGLTAGMLSGPVGLALGAAGLLNMAKTGQPPTTLNVVKSLAQSLGFGGDKNGLSGGHLDINQNNAGGFGAGNLAGTMGGGLGINANSAGTMGPGNNLSGGTFDFAGGGGGSGADMGGMNADTGDRTSEARGFATGGYTGNIGRSAVAGPVHGREFVLSAPATHALGIPLLQLLNSLGHRQAPFGWSAPR